MRCRAAAAAPEFCVAAEAMSREIFWERPLILWTCVRVAHHRAIVMLVKVAIMNDETVKSVRADQASGSGKQTSLADEVLEHLKKARSVVMPTVNISIRNRFIE